MTKPFLRWPGGKRWLSEKLSAEINAMAPTMYIEPFLGAGSVALAVTSPRKLLSDFSRDLINAWKMIARYPDQMAKAASDAYRHFGNTKEGYEDARYAFNSGPPHGITTAATMLYLNAHCFNGIWRVNANGQFNVPFGDVKNPQALTIEHAQEIAAHLARCEIFRDDFGIPIAAAREGHVIFADAPYDEGFVDYTKEGFSTEDQTRLAVGLRAATGRGAHVIATNADTALIRDLYSWATVEPLMEPRSVAAKATARERAACLLIRSPVKS